MILIAEDDTDDQYLLETAFRETGDGDDLAFVPNGVELIRFLHERRDLGQLPLLIFLDLNMPLKGGKEALAEIKEDPQLKLIPVIVYTTTRSQIEIKECYELGANTYIVKPSDFKRLKEVVRVVRNYWLTTATIPEPV